MLFFKNWIRFTNRLFGARIQIIDPDRVQFETNEPNVNLNINVLISTPNKRPPLLKGHFSDAKRWPHKRVLL